MNIFLGQHVVEDYIESNYWDETGTGMRGLSIMCVNEVLYEYNTSRGEIDLDTQDNIGSMVNCIMIDIANSFSNALDFE